VSNGAGSGTFDPLRNIEDKRLLLLEDLVRNCTSDEVRGVLEYVRDNEEVVLGERL
jgi:hypothetical protein